MRDRGIRCSFIIRGMVVRLRLSPRLPFAGVFFTDRFETGYRSSSRSRWRRGRRFRRNDLSVGLQDGGTDHRRRDALDHGASFSFPFSFFRFTDQVSLPPGPISSSWMSPHRNIRFRACLSSPPSLPPKTNSPPPQLSHLSATPVQPSTSPTSTLPPEKSKSPSPSPFPLLSPPSSPLTRPLQPVQRSRIRCPLRLHLLRPTRLHGRLQIRHWDR